MRKTYFYFILLVLVTVISCSKQGAKDPIKLSGGVFGTTYSIIYYDDETNYQKDIQQLFDEVNKSTSTYILSSDISKINRGETNVKVDKYFKEVFHKSKRIYQETNGYFDPTVGNLVNAWGFGPNKPLNNLDSAKVKELLQYVGLDKVSISGNRVIKESKDTFLDFNSIGKGYGIDVIGRFLESKQIKNYLIEIGGEIRVRGTKPEGKKWVIQLENPNTDGSRSAYDLLEVKDISIASSGNYRKFRISESGKKYVHTINPKTGYAKESNLLATTVLAELDCADVDAYATAFMAMGLEKSKAFLKNKPELKVILLFANDRGELKEFRN